MVENNRKQFYALVSDVYAFYKADCSTFALNVWWQAMQPFDFDAAARALNAHAVNPDNGQFLPKPADIVRMLQGGTQDQALRAWTKLDQAVRRIGQYQDVVFDDALIHAVVADMGGWVQLNTKTEEEWPFVRNEFANRYRGYSMRAEVPAYPPMLIGLAGAHNRKGGFEVVPPVLLGDADKALRVMRGGTDKPLLTVTTIAAANDAAALRLGFKDETK